MQQSSVSFLPPPAPGTIVDATCCGFTGGELSQAKGLPACSPGKGRGVFLSVLRQMLDARSLHIPFAGIDESSPQDASWQALRARLGSA